MTTGGPTVSQIAGQSIAHLRDEWEAKREQLEARRARVRITFATYQKELANLEKRYGQAIERECDLLRAIEHGEYGR